MRRPSKAAKMVSARYGCRIEYYDYGWDLVCGSRRVLLVYVSGRQARMTYYRYRQASRSYPDVWLYNSSHNILCRMRWSEFKRLLYGDETSCRKVDMLILTPGRTMIGYNIVLEPRVYRKLMKHSRVLGLAPSEYISKLIEEY